MPLTLVTGPANAAKAGYVLERLRAVLHREPLLVVPTAADVAHYQRELAAGGVVFGAQVLTFARLVREIGRRRRALTARPLGPVARDRVVRAAIARRAAARARRRRRRAPGFAAAAGALFAELQRSLVEPRASRARLRAWGGRAATPTSSRRCTRPTAAGWRRSGARTARARRGRRSTRCAPTRRAGARRPVFLYGFDELTPPQLDAVETLARLAEAEVCVALPYEPGRARVRRAARRRCRSSRRWRGASSSCRSAPSTTPRAPGRPCTTSSAAVRAGGARRAPNGAVRLLEAGGERAEAELVGAEVLELMRDGVAPEDIAVLVRGRGARRCSRRSSAPTGSRSRTRGASPLARTRLGAGVLAGARAALPGGSAADLLAWLRTPGMRGGPGAADALERACAATRVARRPTRRRAGRRGRCARARRARRRGGGGPRRCCALVAEAEAIWAAPHARRADVLDAEERDEARVAAELRSAAARAARRSRPPTRRCSAAPPSVLETLGAVEVRQGDATEGVLARRPARNPRPPLPRRLRVRAAGRRVPHRPVPEPFLDDEARARWRAPAGLRLPLHEDVLDRERSLFYACVSRPQEVLFLSWRSSDEEGEPLVASPFLDDVRTLFTDELWAERGAGCWPR